MNPQPTLFDPAPDPVPPPARSRRTDIETAVAAGEEARRRGPIGRTIALEALQRFPAGLTDFELGKVTGWQQTSIGKRRKDLLDAGLVEAATHADGSFVKRPSPTGTPAQVWRVIDRG